MAVGHAPATSTASRAVWLDRNFGLFLFGHLTSVLGDKLQYVALQIFVLQATGRALAVGFLTAAELLPYLALGVLAGWAADRWGPRRIMISADLVRACLVAAIPLVFPGSLVLLYTLILGVAAGNVLTRPGRAGLTKALAPRHRLVEANSAAITVENAGEVLGFLLGGLAAATLPLATVVYLNAATFLVSAAFLAAIRLPRTAAEGAARATRDWAEEAAGDQGGAGVPTATGKRANAGHRRGTRGGGSALVGLDALRADPVLWANLWVFSGAILVSGGLVPLVVVYLLTVAGGSPVDFGLTRGAAAAGMILGALAVGPLGKRFPKGGLIAAGLAIAGLATLLLPAVPAVTTAVAALFLVGAGNMLYYVPAEALVQERSAPHLVGRLYGTRTAVLHAALLISTLALPALADRVGTVSVLWVSGAALVVCAAIHHRLPPLRAV